MTFADLSGALGRVGLRLGERPAESSGRFSDGGRYRIEIPSCEGPAVLRAVLEEAERRSVPVRRVSQGSGVMMLTDDEISEMAKLGAEASVEISLFLGPRAGWEPGGQSLATSAPAGAVRGMDGIAWCVAEAKRAAALGIRSVLVADLGVLSVLGELRTAGELPANMSFKVSVLMPVANPATARALEHLGAGTLNVSTDLTVEQLAEMRTATSLPLDVYVEVPDIVRAAAPVYVKLGIRNSPNIYPTGEHLDGLAVNLGRERVRRAELVLRLLSELSPDLVEDAGDLRPDDLAIPEV
jgi:hypothetical protein